MHKGGRSALVILLLLAALSDVVAGTQLSPEVRIVGLEVNESSSVLRIAVQRRMQIGEPAFAFNPANCSSTTAGFTRSGTSGAITIFDFQLGVSGRTAIQQHQFIDLVYAAFITSRIVRLAVRDDLCSTNNTPEVTGISLRH